MIIKFLFLFGVIVFIAIFQQQIFSEQSDKNINYKNSYLGFSLQYPNNWTKQEHYTIGSTVDFLSPFTTKNDEYKDYIAVHFIIPKIYFFFPNANTSLTNIANELINYYNSYLSRYDLKVLKNTTDLINGNPAYLLEYEFKEIRFGSTFSIKAKDILIKYNNNLYLISMKAELPNYDRYLKTFNEVIKSLKIQKLPQIHSMTLKSDDIKFSTYQNYTWGVSMQYPSNWHQKEGGFQFYDFPGVPSVCFPNLVSFAPTENQLKNNTNKISLGLNILSVKLPHLFFGINQTLEEHVKTTFEAYGVDSWIPGFSPIYLDFNSTIDGKPAYKFIYFKEGGKYQVLEMGIIANGSVYQISYSSTPEKFLENLSLIQFMIDSIKIGNPHSIPILDNYSKNKVFTILWEYTQIEDDITHQACEMVLM